MVFSSSYTISNHAKYRWTQRIESDISLCEDLVASGDIILDFDQYRYIRNGELFFPCVKIEGGYRVKTVLTWSDMVEPYFQKIVDKYVT
jgi:hypothetical protein